MTAKINKWFKMENTSEYIDYIKNKFSFSQIEESLNRLADLEVLVVGDTIIDKYTYVQQKGRAIKDPILSVEYKNEETYAGGILAVANHVSSFVNKVKVVTLIGDEDSMLDLIKSSLKNNIELKYFVKENAPTTIKQRMIDFYRSNKLFKIEYINDSPITKHLSEEITRHLIETNPQHNLILVGDYGHGFINQDIRRTLEDESKFLSINVQSNSSNMGYNYFTLYKKFDFLTVNESELRLPLSMRFESIEDVIDAAYTKLDVGNFLVTRGKKGCVLVKDGKCFSSPIITSSVKDTVGSGDAVFAISSLCINANLNNELIPFLANCTGGIATNIVGNKESVTKENLLDFVKKVYDNGLE